MPKENNQPSMLNEAGTKVRLELAAKIAEQNIRAQMRATADRDRENASRLEDERTKAQDRRAQGSA